MCVIICCQEQFPSKETISNAEEMNKHGGGIAWLSNGKVHYKKNLNAKDMMKVIKTEAKLPAIIHFRIASIGSVTPDLCHPFPIEEGVSTKLEGISNKVLFHNGTWEEWKQTLMYSVISNNSKLPNGHWSDSRAMAYLAHKHGSAILNLVDGKVAVLSSSGITKYGSGWVDVDKNSCSNNYFIPSKSKVSYDSIAKLYKSYGLDDDDKTLSDDDWYKTTWNKQQTKLALDYDHDYTNDYDHYRMFE